jgi:hypothetical protein
VVYPGDTKRILSLAVGHGRFSCKALRTLVYEGGHESG